MQEMVKVKVLCYLSSLRPPTQWPDLQLANLSDGHPGNRPAVTLETLYTRLNCLCLSLSSILHLSFTYTFS